MSLFVRNFCLEQNEDCLRRSIRYSFAMKFLLSFGVIFGSCLGTFLMAGELVFEKTTIDAAATPDQSVVSVDFAFEAGGEESAIIKRCDAPCSCLEAQLSDDGRLVWAPGEKGIVRCVFDVGNFQGTVSKRISVLMEDGQSHDLTVCLTMPTLLEIEPKTLKWEENSPAERKCFDISISEDHPLEISKISGSNEEKFPFELEEIEEGKSYKLWVTPSDTKIRGFGLLRITTNSEFKRHQKYQAYVVVTKP